MCGNILKKCMCYEFLESVIFPVGIERSEEKNIRISEERGVLCIMCDVACGCGNLGQEGVGKIKQDVCTVHRVCDAARRCGKMQWIWVDKKICLCCAYLKWVMLPVCVCVCGSCCGCGKIKRKNGF